MFFHARFHQGKYRRKIGAGLIFMNLLWYHHMRNEIVQIVASIIMMVFNTSASYFHKNSFHCFEDYLMMKPTLE